MGSPAAFSWGLQRVLEGLPEVFRHWWYLDDGHALGHVHDISQYVRQLQTDLGNMGLCVNLKKCALWGPGTQKLENLMDSDCVQQIPVVPYVPGSGIKVLGIPIIHPEKVEPGTAQYHQKDLKNFAQKNMGKSGG